MTAVDDIEQSAISQGQVTRDFNGNRGAGDPQVNTADIPNLQSIDGLRTYIADRAPHIDVDRISSALRRQPDEYVKDTLRSLADFAAGADVGDALSDLRFLNTQGIQGVDAGGAVVLRTLVDDITSQMADMADGIMDVNWRGLDSRVNAVQLLDEAKAFMTIKKEATMFSSYNLYNWADVPRELVEATNKATREIGEKIDQWTEIFKSGSVEEIAAAGPDFKKFVQTLVVTKGDPTEVSRTWMGAMKAGWESIASANVNALLSSPLTHIRNIVGTGIAVAERPAVEALGYAVQGNWRQARLALTAYDSITVSTMDALAIGRKSMTASESLVSAGSKVELPSVRNRQTLESLEKTATTSTGKWVYGRMLAMHDLLQSPYFTWPGKALQVEDDAFKTLHARMELRHQAAVQADDLARQGTGKYDKGEIYERLIQDKVSTSGESWITV